MSVSFDRKTSIHDELMLQQGPSAMALDLQQFEAPQGQIEESLANIWCELLYMDSISRYDNFFALGGDSLLVVELLENLRQIGLDTTVQEVFDAPTLAMLASKLTRYEAVTVPSNQITKDCTVITPEMLPLISLTQTEIDTVVAQIPGGIANIQDIYGLTPLQSGMLFHHLMAEKSDSYLFMSRLRFVDQTSLLRYTVAMQQLIERHDILRTAFIWDGLSEPVQVVLRKVPSLFTEFSFNGSEKSVLAQLSQKFNRQQYKMDLKHAPLLRLMAAPTSEGSWVALQLMHHSIFDHATLKKLQAEIHLIMNGKIKMLKTPTPFRHFVAQTRLGTSHSDEHIKFFTEMLGDIDEPTLPFGLSDVDRERAEISETYLNLPQSLIQKLRIHARKLQVSLASICHLAWAQVLSKACGHEAVVFGTVLFGQLQDGDENNNVMGPMINTLPIRLDIDQKSVEAAVRHTHAQLSALLTHEHVPLVLAQRCSGVPAGSSLFSALLNYRNSQTTNDAAIALPGVSLMDGASQTEYPLTLSVDDIGSSLNLTAQVSSPFSAARICAYMQQSLESLAYALTHTPKQPIKLLNVMPLEERTMLLHSWNDTTNADTSVCYLHEFFEARVKSDGHAIAVECGGEILSYTELNSRANQLAHYLISKGVKPDDRIAICIERSISLIVAILGILKAGCAYVPLDPAYSNQRLTHILSDADPKFLLADKTGCSTLEDHQIPVIRIDDPLPNDLPIDNPDTTKLGVSPANLAYIIYTSGSTGTPKGVMIEHRQIVRLFEATHKKLSFENREKWCLFHSISFDFSVWEIWGALCNGNQLSIVPYNIIHSMDELYNWICTNGITVLNQTPSAFKMLMRAKNINSRPDCLRYVIFGGEALEPSILRDWYEKYDKGQTVLVNMYGPTEIAIAATTWICDKNVSESSVVPIGLPLDNKRIYLLDSQCEPVPLGAAGEIYIGGAGVARGYLKRLELTAERFLPDPFVTEASARMYRTGDLARYLPDGNLIFLGRVDQQVKIRGFRIELGEIEARLVEHPRVHEAIVLSHGAGTDAYLVAYVVADADTSLANNLRNYLLALLPNYMVPSAYVRLSSIPLTPNGKLDKRALPIPDEGEFARQEYEDPQGEFEEKLAKIWSKLLNVDRIGRRDNFFALGGHSLLIVQLLADLRQIGLETNVREVFNASNLATLASKLSNYKSVAIPANQIKENCTKITPEMLPLINLSQTDIDAIIAQVPGGVTNIQDIYGLTPLQIGMLFHHLLANESDPYLLVSQLSFDDRKTLEHYTNALQQVIERHDILRTVFIWKALSEPVQVVLRQVSSLLTEIALDNTEEPVIDQLSKRFNPLHYRIDLTQAPLIRLMAAPESDGSWKALILMHHTIIDNSALMMLKAEIHAIFNGQSNKLSIPTPFRQVVAQSCLTTNPTEQKHTRFFSEMLGDIDEPTLAFGVDDNRRDGSAANAAQLELSQNLNDQLRALARNLQVSLASICHLAFAQVLSKASGRESVVFGTVLLGRLQAEEENNRVMGPMINTLPLRLDIDEKSVESAVRQAHAQLSSLLDHEHAPLILAQRCSDVPAGSSLFTTLLNYRHNQTTEIDLSIPGVNFAEIVGLTSYPLSLSLDDDDNSLYISAEVVQPMSASQICAYMQQALQSLVDALAQTPEKPVRSLNVIPTEERSLLLDGWNQTTASSLPDCCLHELFEAQVEYDGQAIAVECGGVTMSYAELNLQANQLAHYLIANGAKPDARIALCVERSTKMIVALLGILKSGCAYVPLDPIYSSQRLIDTLHDANPIFLLADATGREALGNEHRVPVINLDNSLPNDLPIDNPDTNKLGLSTANLAYIIYTSGSTGKPKGVMVEHRQIVRLFEPAHYNLDFNKQDTWGLYLSISFDVPAWEIWGSLLYGSRLSILPYSVSRSADELYNWICNSGVTIINPTPSSFKMLMRASEFGLRKDRLRYVCLGGEELDPVIVKDWYDNYDENGTVLVNMYGPTETIVQSTYRRVEGLENINSIGRPLPDLRVYLLDSHGEPVPLGAEGEMYIGGAGVARGYLNRPELTAERFLPDPFSEDFTARMYRTGDRAKYLPDGNLVFLGRVDQQVKIRGFRVELGEIEAQLNSHEQIKESVVLARDDSKGNKRLIAYIVFTLDAPALEPLKIRQYLQNRLPDYMIPAAYVAMDKMPTTQNSKLNHKALPDPSESAFLHQPYEAPISQLESVIADIWKTLLDVDRVSRHDHFFELGGHSLLAITAVNSINQMIDGKIRVSDIFAAPTVKHLAQRIKSQNRTTQLVDLQKTAVLPENIQPLPTNDTSSNNAILLTGATGFVGRFLLRELLDTRQSKIYCLVRGQSQVDCFQRLKNMMKKWCLWRDEDAERIIVVQGDIKKPRLDMDEQTYAKLCSDVNVIFHSAVSMNHLESFEMAYQANVLGLIELLRLATQRTNKIMNFVSTLNVFGTDNHTGDRVVKETTSIKNERHFSDQGYVASKWVGEEIVNQAIERGIACNIFRLGLITADSERARYDELQGFYRMLKSSIQMGMIYDDFDGDILLTPVDFTAKGLAHLGLMHNSAENIFHFTAMDTISRRDFIEQLNVQLALPMKSVSHREWLQEARSFYQRGEVLPITPLIQDMIMSSDEELDQFYKSAKQATITYDSTKTLEKLAQADITLPANDQQWYRLFVDSLTNQMSE